MTDEFAQQEPSAAASQEAAERAAAHMAHPHTRLKGILDGLRTPPSLDISGRVASLHSALAQLTQLMLEHTPAPEQEKPHEG